MLATVLNDDLFSEKVVQAAAHSGCAGAAHMMPSTTRALNAADRLWFSMSAELINLTGRANSALDSARFGDRIGVQADTGRRQLTLSYEGNWLRLNRERVLGRGHITVERSYRLPPYPPEPGGPADLEDLLVELVATGRVPEQEPVVRPGELLASSAG